MGCNLDLKEQSLDLVGRIEVVASTFEEHSLVEVKVVAFEGHKLVEVEHTLAMVVEQA